MSKNKKTKKDSIEFRISKEEKQKFLAKLLKKGYSGFTEFLRECIRKFMQEK